MLLANIVPRPLSARSSSVKPPPVSSPSRSSPPSSPYPQLRGVLLKKHRHHHLVVKWGRRFFEVDDELGLLYYFKTRAGQDWDEPARHFALAALLSVRSVDASAGPHALEIRYRATSVQAEEAEVAFGSTLKLLLRADSKADQLRWIDGLQARIRRQQPGNGLVQSGVVVDPTDRLYVATAGGGLVPRPLPAARVITPVAPAASASTSAIESATLAANRAAARAASEAAAVDICVAMGAQLPSDGSSGGGGRGRGGGRGGGGGRRKQHVDLATFLVQRQQEVWAELASSGDVENEVPPDAFAPPPPPPPVCTPSDGDQSDGAASSTASTPDTSAAAPAASQVLFAPRRGGGRGRGRGGRRPQGRQVAAAERSPGASALADAARRFAGADEAQPPQQPQPVRPRTAEPPPMEATRDEEAAAATAGTGEEELPTEVAPYSAPLQAADYGLEAAATSESAAAAGAMEATAQAHRGGRPPPPLPSTDRVLPVTQGVAAVLGSTDGAAKLSAEQLQLQMMIAMGATPVTAEGTRGSARAAAILSQHSPTDAVLDAWS